MTHEASATEHQSVHHYEYAQDHFVYLRFLKRLCDLILLALAIPVVAPLILLLWLAVRMDGGPGFFGHLRVGKNDTEFTCWKLRTMVPNAEQRLKEYLAACPEARSYWDSNFKLQNDFRVSRLGRILRTTSLDELPQLWNVLKGEMSFIGPRPVTADEMVKYNGYTWAYSSLRPGISGLWQVSGRNCLTYADRVKLDVQYCTSISLKGDLNILVQTVKTMVQRSGL